MATTIPCKVDTNPMAHEIDSVSRHVNGTTAAVVTMQAAVIAAETDGANKVCRNVNRGFFTMMRSQISQKIANKQSRVEALMMQLTQQKRRLLTIKTNMEREYGRIAERYIRIFTLCNKELESRIMQVDQPVFELVNKHMTTSSNRMNSLSGWVSTSQQEGLTQSQQILMSRMKNNARTALEESTSFLSHLGEQRALTGRVLISNPAGNDDRAYRVPVAIWETVSDSSGLASTDVKVPDMLSNSCFDAISNALRGKERLPWNGKGDTKRVTTEFEKLVDASHSDNRVKEMMRKMYASAQYETL